MAAELTLRTSLSDLLTGLAKAIDLTGVEGGWSLRHHGQQVAIAALAVAEQVGLDEEQKRELFLAALIHDAGVSSSKEKLTLLHLDLEGAYAHAESGYRLLRRLRLLQGLAKAVRHHHDRWSGPNESGLEGEAIPLLARIIHLADRICILIKGEEYVLHQRGKIVEMIQEHSGTLFQPELVSAFRMLAERESFWLDLTPEGLESALVANQPTDGTVIALEDVLQIANIFAQIVDNKSRFTYRHSLGVARVAVELAKRFLLPETEQVWIRVAGLLHDLGKLAVPDAILDKPGRLDAEEMQVMKQHTYHTFQVLAGVGGFETVAEWAAFHHERLDGKGYPFHRDKTNLSLQAKIMAVADAFQALNQRRPYRSKLPPTTVMTILAEQAENGGLEPESVNVLRRDYLDFQQAAVP